MRSPEQPGTVRTPMYWEAMAGGRVRCRLCPHQCVIPPGRTGVCRVRRNVDGQLVLEGYGRVAAIHLDPVEKKPLFHFYPGSYLLSMGTAGCNLRCRFCQNWEISQVPARTGVITPQEAVELALQVRRRGCVGLAYTYSEPTIWYEFVLDTAREAHRHGLVNAMITNGYIEPDPLAALLPWMDAFNVDVKSFDPAYYKKVVSGRLEPVLRTVEAIYRAGQHVEVTTLLVTGLNDSEEEIEALARWLASISPDIPLHLTRFHPDYLMRDRPATPRTTMEKARDVARRFLHYVYLGNLFGAGGEDTICPRCGAVLIARDGYDIHVQALEGGRCSQCGLEIPVRGPIRGEIGGI